MTYYELKKLLSPYYPAVYIDRVISYKIRKRLNLVIFSVTVLLFVLFVISIAAPMPQPKTLSGFFYIMLALSLAAFAGESFHRSIYFKDISLTLSELHIKQTEARGGFLLATVLAAASGKNLARDFFTSGIGTQAALRLGLSTDTLAQFFQNQQLPISLETLYVSMEKSENIFSAYLKSLYGSDPELKEFLFSQGIQEKELAGLSEWLTLSAEKTKRRERWWGRDNLGRIPGIGKDWSYGQIYGLLKYGRPIQELYDTTLRGVIDGHTTEVGEIESILARSAEANALIVGDDEMDKMDLVIVLAKKIFSGNVLPPLEHKVVFVLDINALIAATGNKSRFEAELIKILNQAVKSGHVLLVIPDLPSFIMSGKSLGSDIVSLMDPSLTSSSLQIIAMTDTLNFHEQIETNPTLSQRFEKIMLRADDETGLLAVLLNKADSIEKEFGVLFTYPAILAVAENASRYFIGQDISDKAGDLLAELPARARHGQRKIITKKDVLDLVETKTGIPTGDIKKSEKEKLVHLEEILHKRIIAQDEAISAISNALRRARSDIGSSNRPLGSFLFLGPTGVGKTETTKALAQVFFGDENKILRLDMSEYNAPDSLTRLLGSFEGGKAGILSSLLRENPYGVLLLDEFEKANPEIHDLFLQILDEGIFSDMMGKKVNGRNLIIIATSNAASDLIWDYVKRGEKLGDFKASIIEAIIKNGIFKPELLNRFDGIILFHPLEESQLRRVAILMLGRLQKRLEAKNLELIVNDALIDYLMSVGSDPKFGARPINRAIQDKVEGLIANKIIKGEIKAGSKITLTKEELEKKV